MKTINHQNVKCDLSHFDSLPAIGYVIDGMAMLQSLNTSYFKTFNDLSQQVLKKILRLLEQEDLGTDVVTVVFVRYDKDDSIKQMERRRQPTERYLAVSSLVFNNFQF